MTQRLLPSVPPDFVCLAPRTSLFIPATHTNGQLIILCTWLGAAPKHVAKYAALYRRIAPQARILLIESTLPIMVSSYAKQRAATKPAVTVVLDTLSAFSHTPNRIMLSSMQSISEGSKRAEHPKILLHAFSNGGYNSAAQLLLSLKTQTGWPLPLTAVIFDSCPGKGTYWQMYNALMLSLPKGVVWRVVGTVIVHCLLLVMYVSIACGGESPFTLMRRVMLEGTTVSGTRQVTDGESGEGGEKKACHLYSKADEMVDWTDVKDHAEEARRKGWSVKEVVFEGSGHCAHLAKDEERYVVAVREMWQD